VIRRHIALDSIRRSGYRLGQERFMALFPLTTTATDGPRGNVRMPTWACMKNDTFIVKDGVRGLGRHSPSQRD